MICLVSLFTGQKILGSLRLLGIDSAKSLLRGDLKLVSNLDSFVQGRSFSFPLLEQFINNQYEESEHKEFPSIRFLLDLGWMEGNANASLLASREFSRKMLDFRGLKNTTFLFLYDLSRFPSNQLLLALEAHPQVFIRGVKGDNLFHIPPGGGAEPLSKSVFHYRCNVLQAHFVAKQGSTETPSRPETVNGKPIGKSHNDDEPGKEKIHGEGIDGLKRAAYIHVLEIMFGADLSIQKIFSLLLQEAKTLSESSVGLVGTIDRTSGLFLVRAKDPFFHDECQIVNDFGQRCIRLKPDGLMGTLCRHVSDSGSGFFGRDILNHDLVKGLPHRLPSLASVLIVPIHSGGQKIGVLALGNPLSNYRETNLKQVQEFARTFGLILNQYQLSENLEILEKAMSQIVEAVVITSLDGKIISWNPNFELVFNISDKKPLGSNIFPWLFPGMGEEMHLSILDSLHLGNFWKGECKPLIPGKPALELDISVSSVVQEVEEQTVLVWAMRPLSKPAVPKKEGPILSRGSGPEFSGEILSEFQKTLTLILGNVEMLPLSFENIDSNQENIREIRSAVDRARSLVNGLKSSPG
jgi:PAS domain-containing protein